jgi:hypothetical protein
MRLNILISAFLALLTIGEALAAKDEITIYLVKNRSAQELAKVASSIFAGKANITSSNEKIVISASPKTTAQVVNLLDELDQRQKTLRVSFRWRGESAQTTSDKGVSGGVGGKGWRGKISPKKENGASVSVGGVTVSANEGAANSQSSGTQSILLTGSGEGKIALAQLASGSFLRVKVTPLASKLVNLEVAQVGQEGALVGGIQTHITVPMGQWRSLGGVRTAGNSRESQIASGSAETSGAAKELEVQVEQVQE